MFARYAFFQSDGNFVSVPRADLVTNVRNFHECAAGMNLAIERGRV